MKAIIGLGKTGWSCVEYCARLGESLIVFDTREHPPYTDLLAERYPHIALISGELSFALLSQAEELIVSPGVSLKTPALLAASEQGIPCIGDIELFARAVKAPIIAITGSNGKTTLTTLMGKILRDAGYAVQVCGNIGTPVLETLEEQTPDFYVIELSSFQLETTYSLKAKVALVLNISEDHMDRYDSLQAYALAKQRIYEGCEVAIINADDSMAWQGEMPGVMQRFSVLRTENVDFFLKRIDHALWYCTKEHPLFCVHELPLQGTHHYQNTLAALAIGSQLGISIEQMYQTLKSFHGLPHRCQKIMTLQGVDWYNDSKATNVGAVVAALLSLGPFYRNIILIAGGDAKGADLSELTALFSRHVSQLVLLGRDAHQFERLFHDTIPCVYVKNLAEAVSVAAQAARPGDAVALSPACSSLDMFKNYEERGELFVKAVEEWANAQAAS